jgi:hypothetical protein
MARRLTRATRARTLAMIRRCARHQHPDDRDGDWYRVPTPVLVRCPDHGGGTFVQPPNLMLCTSLGDRPPRHLPILELLEWREPDDA